MAASAAAAWAAGAAVPVLGHDGGTMGISLTSERLPPGGALEVIGTDFAPGETLQFRLVGPAAEWSLPDVTTGPDGHFAVVLSVPTDAGAGFYTIDAVSRSGIVQRETFQVELAARAPALTPSPAGPGGLGVPIDQGGPAWTLLPLVALGIVALTFAAVVVRNRPRASSPGGPATGT